MRKHPADFVSLVFGLLIVGTAAAVVISVVTDVDIDLRLALPIAFVSIGVIGLLGSIVAQRRSSQRERAAAHGADALS